MNGWAKDGKATAKHCEERWKALVDGAIVQLLEASCLFGLFQRPGKNRCHACAAFRFRELSENRNELCDHVG